MRTRISISSKKQIVLIMSIFVVPIIVFLIGYNFYTVNILNSNIAQTNKNTIYLYQRSLEKSLRDIDYFMSDLVANDFNYQQLRYKINPLDSHLYTLGIVKKFISTLNTQQIIGGLFIYTDNNDMFRKAYSESYPYESATQIEDYLKSLIETGEDYGSRGWFAQKIGGSYMLFRVLGSKGLYVICMVDFDRIVKPQDSDSNQKGEFLLFSSVKGEPLTMIAKVNEDKIALKENDDSFYFTGNKQRYLVVQDRLEYAKINIVHVMPYYGVFKSLGTVQFLLLVASLFIIFLIPVSYYLLRRSFFLPLERLVDIMNRIKDGNLDAKMKNSYKIYEFKQVSETFNDMIDQIKRLKIGSYERELETQQAKLQYLQLQIRPHFFLNCLKNLYGMAEEKKYKKIQEMILVLSKHMRYMFRDNSILVPLSDELHSVKNYIMLQQMSASKVPICNMDIETQLMDFHIPPLSILTFVENSVKHGAHPERQLIINIKAMLLKSEDEDYLNITISDNGQGFSPEMLTVLNSSSGKLYSDEQVGISNVKHRFSLIYGNKSVFSFYNQVNGACTEIFLPYGAAETE